MDSRKIQVYMARVYPKSVHTENYRILSIPGRDDVYFVFRKGWGNRLFLVWECNGKIHCKLLGGNSSCQVIPEEKTLAMKDNVVQLYCGVMNFIGASPGVLLRYRLGKVGYANPKAVS